MNKPTVLAILDAFKKVLSDKFPDPLRLYSKSPMMVGLQAAFLCELDPLIKANQAKHLSRLVALGELAASVGEAFDMFAEPLAVTVETRVNAEQHIGPWFELLRKLCK